MGAKTGIEWTDHTFNPWMGCTKVSPACANCYAEVSSAVRAAGARVDAKLWGPTAARVVTSDAYWKQPERWNREALAAGVRRRVFCASLADVFEERKDLEGPRERLHQLVTRTPGLDWLLLTKRPEAVARVPGGIELAQRPNAWMGTTVEDQKHAEQRIPALLAIPARIRFLSAEPLLGPVDLGRWLATAHITCKPCGRSFWLHEAEPCKHSPNGWTLACPGCGACKCVPSQPDRGDSVSWGPPSNWPGAAVPGARVGRFDRVHPTIKLRLHSYCAVD